MLFIVGDCKIHDLKAMRRALIDLSEYPCSVVFIALGIDYTADIRDLEDSITKLVDEDGRRPKRHCTKLVRYHTAMTTSPDHFIASCLEQVPKQAHAHMKRNNLLP